MFMFALHLLPKLRVSCNMFNCRVSCCAGLLLPPLFSSFCVNYEMGHFGVLFFYYCRSPSIPSSYIIVSMVFHYVSFLTPLSALFHRFLIFICRVQGERPLHILFMGSGEGTFKPNSESRRAPSSTAQRARSQPAAFILPPCGPPNFLCWFRCSGRTR